MPPLDPRGSVQADPGLPLSTDWLTIAALGCFVVFLAIPVVFGLIESTVSRLFPPDSAPSDRPQTAAESSPPCQHTHHRHGPLAARRGLAQPVGSMPRYGACSCQCKSTTRTAGSDKASRVSQGHPPSPPPPPPYASLRHAPTGVSRMPVAFPRRPPRSSSTPSESASFPATPAGTTPHWQSLGAPRIGRDGARGPTAALLPVVW